MTSSAWTSETLAPYPEESGNAEEPQKSTKAKWWVFAGIAVVGMVAMAVAAFVLLKPESNESTYLGALKKGGLAGQFNSDANAIAHGKQVCRDLDAGGVQQGRPEDKVAVDAFCSKFSKGFHVLETATVDGSFTLMDTSYSRYSSAISSYGSGCEGDGGYSDISSGTEVIVKNSKGDVLAQTPLGTGSGTSTICTFKFSLEVSEGENQYIVSVSHRGDKSYSFTELKDDGIHLSLG
jgi:hypothetical protein